MALNPLAVIEELVKARCDLSSYSTQFMLATAIDEVRQEIEGLIGENRKLQKELESKTVKFEMDDPDEVDDAVCSCEQCTCQETNRPAFKE